MSSSKWVLHVNSTQFSLAKANTKNIEECLNSTGAPMKSLQSTKNSRKTPIRRRKCLLFPRLPQNSTPMQLLLQWLHRWITLKMCWVCTLPKMLRVAKLHKLIAKLLCPIDLNFPKLDTSCTNRCLSPIGHRLSLLASLLETWAFSMKATISTKHLSDKSNRPLKHTDPKLIITEYIIEVSSDILTLLSSECKHNNLKCDTLYLCCKWQTS